MHLFALHRTTLSDGVVPAKGITADNRFRIDRRAGWLGRLALEWEPIDLDATRRKLVEEFLIPT
jgi:hypothetical protein